MVVNGAVLHGDAFADMAKRRQNARIAVPKYMDSCGQAGPGQSPESRAGDPSWRPRSRLEARGRRNGKPVTQPLEP